MSRRTEIPARLNLLLLAAAACAAGALLWVASATSWWTLRLAAAAAFSLVGNTLFALLHEAVHGILHPHRGLNEWLGRIAAAFFPTGLTFQRICHLGHHRRNRSDAELFDYYRPGDSRTLKLLQWYGILTGVYWLTAPLGCALYLILAPVLGARLLRLGRAHVLRSTGATAMLSGFQDAPVARICLEILFSVGVQLGLIWGLDLSLTGWIACYAAFALQWSSLQYADHAWSALDTRTGAWNLRVNPVLRAFFLNYHDHRVHHEHPELAWIQLPQHVDPREFRPWFGSVYLAMWGGPRPYPAATEAEHA